MCGKSGILGNSTTKYPHLHSKLSTIVDNSIKNIHEAAQKRERRILSKKPGNLCGYCGGGTGASKSACGRANRPPSGGGYPQIHKVHPRFVDNPCIAQSEKGHRYRKYPQLHSKLSTIVDNCLSFFHKIRRRALRCRKAVRGKKCRAKFLAGRGQGH